MKFKYFYVNLYGINVYYMRCTRVAYESAIRRGLFDETQHPDLHAS